MNTYEQRRADIYEPLRQEGLFTWDWMCGEEYALASILCEPRAMYEELSQAAERLGRIFQRVKEVLRRAEDGLLLELGVPGSALQAVRESVWQEVPTVIGRFDFAWTADGPKMLEFNSDTPTGIVEAYVVNDRACRYYGVPNPNAGKEHHLLEAFQQIAAAYRSKGYPIDRIAFTALGWHEEDAATARYLLQQSGLAPAQFVALEELRVYEDRLCQLTAEGEHMPIDLLYRLHPIEKLAEEHDDDGYPTGEHVIELMAQRKLAVINPPDAFLIQSKAVQALIWSLYEQQAFFDAQELGWIGRYMLPTYLDNRFAGREAYVSKPFLGREGGGVTLYDASGGEMERDGELSYWEQPMIYQQAVQLPVRTVETLSGPYEGHVLWGVYLIGGQPSATVARIGSRITNNLSCFVPAAVREP